MRIILLSMFCGMFLAANGQTTCDTWVVKKYDKMTDLTSYETTKPFKILDNTLNGITIQLIKGEYATIWAITVYYKDRCIKKDAQMIVLLKNGERLTFTNNTDYNCKGNFFVYFSDMNYSFDKFKLLASKEIDAIRVWTEDEFIDVNLNTKQSTELLSIFKCFDEKQF